MLKFVLLHSDVKVLFAADYNLFHVIIRNEPKLK